MLLALLSLMLGVTSLDSAEPMSDPQFDADSVVALLELVIDADEDSARQCFAVLAEKSQTGEITANQIESLQRRLGDTLDSIIKSDKHPLYPDAAILASSWKNPTGRRAARAIAIDSKRPDDQRLAAFASLLTSGDADLTVMAAKLLADNKGESAAFRGKLLSALGRLEKPEVGLMVLETYTDLENDLKPRAIELLTQRASWGKLLLGKIKAKQISSDHLNVNQIKKLLASGDPEIDQKVNEIWGAIRTERNQQREVVVNDMRRFLAQTPGDPHRGSLVFAKVCGQCHKIYGEGHEVGPDITGNGRGSFEQLLSNVFDPSLVIGEAYQARTVITLDGRVLSGLPAEDSEQRIVLKMQGGKTETIAREDVDQMQTSKLSLMPEGLESQLKPQELADLFAFLALDKSPKDPKARFIPGTPTAFGNRR